MELVGKLREMPVQLSKVTGQKGVAEIRQSEVCQTWHKNGGFPGLGTISRLAAFIFSLFKQFSECSWTVVTGSVKNVWAN
jgi:hypothetical protein